MKRVDALILHGKPSRERYENPLIPKPHDANWLPWLAAQLSKSGLATAIPQFPLPYSPDYGAWKNEFEQYDVEQGRVIAHSAGAEFVLRWLSENQDVSLRQLLLVAPWTDSGNKYGEFSSYTLDTNLVNRIGRVTIVNSVDDSSAIQDNVIKLRAAIEPVKYVEFEDFGHFMIGNNMPDVPFPQLLEEID